MKTKIPLRLVDGRLMVTAALTSDNYHFGIAHIIFIVDTGSDSTFIGHNDALTLQIPLDTTTFKESFKMGAGSYSLCEGKQAVVYFKTEEKKLFEIKFEGLPIGLSIKKGKKKENEVSILPSIIGTDFLIKNKLSLYFNPTRGEAYLESEN